MTRLHWISPVLLALLVGSAPAEDDKQTAPPPASCLPVPIYLSRPPRVQGVLGTTPVPTERERAEYNKYIDRIIDPRSTLDLVANRPRLMILKQPPRRIQMGDERIATCNLLTPTELSIAGRQLGSTVFNLWFADPKNPDKDIILSYRVRVFP